MPAEVRSHRRNRVEAARGNDLGTGPLGLLVVLVDHALHPQRLPRQVAAMNPGGSAGGYQLAPVMFVRADRRHNDLFGFIRGATKQDQGVRRERSTKKKFTHERCNEQQQLEMTYGINGSQGG